MNHVSLSGRVVKNAIVTGEGRVLKFLLSCKHRYKQKNSVVETKTIVPCVIFDAADELKKALQEPSKASIYLTGHGRVTRSSYEKPDGEKHYSTDIVLEPVTVSVRKQ